MQIIIGHSKTVYKLFKYEQIPKLFSRKQKWLKTSVIPCILTIPCLTSFAYFKTSLIHTEKCALILCQENYF